jgi:hypothetical protein
MDGSGFDFWGSQASRSSSPASAAQASLDLNTQVPAAEGFLDLGLYGAFLQSGDDELLLSGRVRGSGLPPYRPPRGREGDGWAPPLSRQLTFGGSSSASAGQGGGNSGVFLGRSSTGAGGGVLQRANSAVVAPSRHNQRTSTAARGRARGGSRGGGQRVPLPQAPRSAIRGQASDSGSFFDNSDEELEEDVEELASFGGPR